MKKISFILLITMFCGSVMAQRAQLGIKAGINLANLNDKAVPTTDTRTGYHVGALAHIHLSDAFAIQPEVMYSLQGAEYGAGRNRLNYINIPVLLQFMHASGFRVQSGPQLGIMTGATAKRGASNVNIEKEVKTRDFSWAFGAGYLSRVGVGVDVRYNLGISSNREPDGNDLQNRVWQLGLFWQKRR